MGVVKPMRPPPAGLRAKLHASAVIRCGPVSFTLLAWMLLTAVVSPLTARAQPNGVPQYDVEAVYVYNFAKFVRWPAGSAGAPVQICVAAQSVFVDSLTKVVAGESIDTRPLKVRAIQRPEDLAACDIMFIDVSAKERLAGLLAATTDKPVLTVSDIPGFLDGGGMIQLLLIDNRVRFSVDLGHVQRSRIALSSELLKVAVTVRGQPSGGGAP